MTTMINGEQVEMTEAEREEMGLTPTEASTLVGPALTIRVFRSRFADTDEDFDLYDALATKMEAERPRLVRQQWADPGAEVVEGGALYNAIDRHLTDLTTPERKAELLART